ncbi:MAG: ABC transporter permease subunit [Lachnospiraceae bacterium]|nr:ABC transporter permease subunit [Lachnospiraceae bacterium]
MRKKNLALTEQKWFQILFWAVIVIAAWEIGATVVAATKRTPENILPHLYQIIAAAFSMKAVSGGMTATGVVLTSARATLFRALGGFAIGAGLGFLLALLMKLSGLVEKLIFPYLMLIQLIPVLGLAPIILAITGDINRSRLVIAAILSFYPVAANTLAGFKAVSRDKYDLMFTYAAKKRQLYTKVLIPSAVPYLFTGLKIAAPMAVTASILVDTLQGDGGLGCMLSQSLKHAMSIYVFWLIVFFSAFIGIFSTYLISWIEVLVSPEKRSTSGIGRMIRKEKKYECSTEKNRTQKEPGTETL